MVELSGIDAHVPVHVDVGGEVRQRRAVVISERNRGRIETASLRLHLGADPLRAAADTFEAELVHHAVEEMQEITRSAHGEIPPFLPPRRH